MEELDELEELSDDYPESAHPPPRTRSRKAIKNLELASYPIRT